MLENQGPSPPQPADPGPARAAAVSNADPGFWDPQRAKKLHQGGGSHPKRTDSVLRQSEEDSPLGGRPS